MPENGEIPPSAAFSKPRHGYQINKYDFIAFFALLGLTCILPMPCLRYVDEDKTEDDCCCIDWNNPRLLELYCGNHC